MQGLTQVRPIDPLLTGFGVEFMQNAEAFVVDDMAPIVRSKGDTGTYYIWEPRNNFALERTEWGTHGGGFAARVEIRATKDTYGCIKYAVEVPITDDDRRNSLDPASLERRAMNKVARTLMLDRERRFAAAVITSPDTTLTTTKWGGGGGSPADPRGVMDTAKQTILKNIGELPNTFLIAADSYFDIIKNTAANSAGLVIKNAIQYVLAVTAGNINPGLLAQFFDIERVIVGWAVADTQVEPLTIGSAKLGSGDYLWKNLGVIAFVNPNPGPDTVNFYTTFASVPFVADRYREERGEQDILRGKQVLVEKQVCRNAAYTIASLTT